jgi:hypothetical protein
MAEGYLRSTQGNGTFVAEGLMRAGSDHSRTAFAELSPLMANFRIYLRIDPMKVLKDAWQCFSSPDVRRKLSL